MGSSGLTINGAPNSAGMMDEWNFDETIRGTMKGIPVNLDMTDWAGYVEEEGDEDEDEEEDEVPWASVRVRVDGNGIGDRFMNVSYCLQIVEV